MSANRGSTGNNSLPRSIAQSDGQQMQEYQQQMQEYQQRMQEYQRRMQEYQQQMLEWGERMQEYGRRMRGGSEQEIRESGERMRECGERMREFGRNIRECGKRMREIGREMQQLAGRQFAAQGNNENAAAAQPPPAVAPQHPLLGFSDADIDRVSTTFNYVEPPESSSTKDHGRCTICLEPFKADQCMRKLRCGHEFHSSCVVPWLRRQTTCPNCRRKLSLKR